MNIHPSVMTGFMFPITQCCGWALSSSRAMYGPTSVQSNYIATQDPQALCDMNATWPHHLCMTQLCKPLCTYTRPLKAGHVHSTLSLLQLSQACVYMSSTLINSSIGFCCVFCDLFWLAPGNFSRTLKQTI